MGVEEDEKAMRALRSQLALVTVQRNRARQDLQLIRSLEHEHFVLTGSEPRWVQCRQENCKRII